MKSWFQSLLFQTVNFCTATRRALEKVLAVQLAAEAAAEVGGCMYNLTHSLKVPGFNPRAL
jgi:hypothetical protein